MKNFLIGIIIICMIGLIGVNVKIMFNMDEMNSKFEEKTDLLQSEIKDIKQQEPANGIVNDENLIREPINVEIEEIPIGKVSKEKFKVCEDSDTCYYEKNEPMEFDDLGVKIEISNNKAYLTMDTQNENLSTIIDKTNFEKLKNVKNQEITGFSAKPTQVYYGEFGQDVIGRVILFLMDDGTVEYIKLMNMLENQTYKSTGKIQNLSDVKQFDVLSVSDTEGGGYVTTIAIDKDGYYYDLNELL